jgi:hypothetical protein
MTMSQPETVTEGQLPLWGLPVDFPWGKPALVRIPEEFWTDDWCRGLRYRVYLGEICSHSDPSQSLVCVQPRRESQAEGMESPCIPFDLDHAEIQVLEGKLSDYR